MQTTKSFTQIRKLVEQKINDSFDSKYVCIYLFKYKASNDEFSLATAYFCFCLEIIMFIHIIVFGTSFAEVINDLNLHELHFNFSCQCLQKSIFADKVLSNYEIFSSVFFKDIRYWYCVYSSWMCKIGWATRKAYEMSRPNSLWKGVDSLAIRRF